MHQRARLVPCLTSVKRHTLYIADLMFWRMLDLTVHLMRCLDAFLSINRFISIGYENQLATSTAIRATVLPTAEYNPLDEVRSIESDRIRTMESA